MFKRKLYLFAGASSVALVVVLLAAAVSAQITRQNLSQSTMAQTLLIEHQQLSSISYRLFKQLTDGLIFGQTANQAEVRNKKEQIDESLSNIRRLELTQRESLGAEATRGSVEDTEDLALLITQIIEEFQSIAASGSDVPLSRQERVRTLLEVTIDNQFREAINDAVSRQSNVVAAINARIDTLNTAIVWFTAAFGLLGLPLIVLACRWLINQLYPPLQTISSGAEALAQGNYDHRLPDTLDQEFLPIVQSFNSMGRQLQEHKLMAERSRKQLEFEVEQRTKELMDANNKLTDIDNRRRQFLADLSHELRTPLTVIRGEAQVTLRQPIVTEDASRQTLESILNQAVGLSRLVDDLLLLARADSGQLVIEPQWIDMASWLRQQTEHWQRLAPTHRIEMEWALDDEGAQLYGDEQRLTQVIAILVINAVKYSDPNTRVMVKASQSATDFRISVIDQGPGISPSDLPYIFERFVRINRSIEGSGLGLAIARTIAEAHHGELSVESVVGRGSAFTLTLPREPQP
ncbi:MAG TPA: two-component sensor histidine kinase [Pseudohongiella sp.]|nr:two-component sensor histidine kinase [Pseudohongiella sp.]HBX37271.1 two-component sensor histidine kinase [Pseudohongiella sp.]|tara:strand:+ start:1463 stop:3022 length:1560 start_codon:yes stop_codon:yes gene_type:complete